MSEIRRVNPRRPYRMTPEGVRRIVLGDTSVVAGPYAGAASRPALSAASKPLRPRRETAAWHLAIVHADRGDLDTHAREAIAAAAILAPPDTGIVALILGSYAGDAGVLGADVILVRPECGTRFDPEAELAVASLAVAEYAPKHVFLPDKPESSGDLGRRLIAAEGFGGAAHAVEVNASRVSVRWLGGAGFATAPLPRVVLLEPGTVEASLPFRGVGESGVLAAVEANRGAIRDLGTETLDTAEIDLAEADFIVSAGNGVSDIALLETLAGMLGAAVGASRVAVDEGKLARHRQIGATGKTVGATTYIAIGISGAVQHLQGIKACRHVIAVNLDPGAPIVQRADLTIIGDAEQIMQALVSLIAVARVGKTSPEAA